MKKGHYIFSIISLVIEIDFILFSLFCLLWGVGNPLVWFVMLVMEAISLLGSIREIKKYRQHKKSIEEGDGHHKLENDTLS